MRPLLLSLILATALAPQAIAATAYEIRLDAPVQTLRIGDDAITPGGVWTAHVDGTRFRLDSSNRELLYDSLLSLDGKTIEALNSGLQTWYVVDDPFFRLRSRFLNEYEEERAKKIEWNLSSGEGSTPSERVYRGTLGYTLPGPGGTTVDYHATIEILTDITYDRALWPGSILPRTKHPAVNAKLDGADALIEGFPRRLLMTTTRRYRGGDPYSESMTVTVSNIRQIPTDDKRFRRPPSYRHQKPVVAAPGVLVR